MVGRERALPLFGFRRRSALVAAGGRGLCFVGGSLKVDLLTTGNTPLVGYYPTTFLLGLTM